MKSKIKVKKKTVKLVNCTKCMLCRTRTQVVLGHGSSASGVMFVGEAPGQKEDEQGKPFVGRAGKILDEAFGKVGIDRNKVYITNCVKCRPPQNRDPHPSEKIKCSVWLTQEIKIMKPKLVVTLGKHAYQSLMSIANNIIKDRDEDTGITVLNIFDMKVKILDVLHPAATLYDPNKKKKFFRQIKKVKKYIRG